MSRIEEAPPPAPGAVTRTTIHESARTVTQILRLAPGGEIAEHHHPAHDESLVVERGTLTVQLNGVTHRVSAGDVAVLPAGTVISGRNAGADEARVVVVFSGTGASGPLTVPGRPHH